MRNERRVKLSLVSFGMGPNENSQHLNKQRPGIVIPELGKLVDKQRTRVVVEQLQIELSRLVVYNQVTLGAMVEAKKSDERVRVASGRRFVERLVRAVN